MHKGKTYKIRKDKLIAGIIVGLSASMMATGGTYAWYSSQQAVNEFKGTLNQNAVLHDDFDGTNKDVYIENTGNSPFYVRVKFDEFMQMTYGDKTTESLVKAEAVKNDKTTWTTHRFNGTDITNDGDLFHNYYGWEFAAADKTVEYKPATANTSGKVGKYDTTDTTGDGNIAGAIVSDGFYTGETGNKETPAGQIITLTAYNKRCEDTDTYPDFKDNFTGWVLDDDGWAYWYTQLTGGKTTSLLLDSVTEIKKPSDGREYYYAINVVLEAVSEKDLPAWFDDSKVTPEGAVASEDNQIDLEDASSQAQIFLKQMSESYHEIAELKKTDTTTDFTIYDILPVNSDESKGDGFLDASEYKTYKDAIEASN